ncbi:DNA-binding protein YbaB [Micromonospora pisi]|uniref:DNA-binding protein YbaB n=1 Tax=Micromonospora pisi TaxID=589240 RepID=A0A495JUR9_9ACTN|nr:YbaB/EbfC family nucleoid-associated protein [Micromonospora pisi]RKR91879.1 DNA-binding protein YbaB [Micromonospora pisi]
MDAAAYGRFAEDLRAVQRGMAEVRASAESSDGLITVTVGGRGELLELALDPRIYREHDARALSRRILDTVREASGLAHAEVVALTRHLMPPEATDPNFDPLLADLDRMARGRR